MIKLSSVDLPIERGEGEKEGIAEERGGAGAAALLREKAKKRRNYRESLLICLFVIFYLFFHFPSLSLCSCTSVHESLDLSPLCLLRKSQTNIRGLGSLEEYVPCTT
jgi:hypothetical protein